VRVIVSAGALGGGGEYHIEYMNKRVEYIARTGHPKYIYNLTFFQLFFFTKLYLFTL